MRITAPALACAALVAASVIAPAPAHAYGTLVDVSWFTAAIPADFSASSDFPDCDYERFHLNGRHHQRIYAGGGPCNGSAGAPEPGDVSIFQRFPAVPGEYYKGYAVARMDSGDRTRAQVKMLFRDASQVIGECYGYTESSTFVTVGTAANTLGVNGHAAPYLSPYGGCRAPNGTTMVSIAFRAHATAQGADGTAVLAHLRFGECFSNGNCSNIPPP